MHGEEKAALSAGIGWRALNEEMERFKDNLEFTKLEFKQEGLDPDAVFTRVPYEKGCQFLWRIERQVFRIPSSNLVAGELITDCLVRCVSGF